MRLTINQKIDAIVQGVSTEEYSKRLSRLRRLGNERLELMDSLDVLKGDANYITVYEKKKKRLLKVNKMISDIKKTVKL